MNRKLRVAGLTVLAATAAGALAALVVRNQITRHQRDLFSPRALKRLAALGHVGKVPASVDNIRLLRDFIVWEPRKMLRERARSILARMETEISATDISPAGEPA